MLFDIQKVSLWKMNQSNKLKYYSVGKTRTAQPPTPQCTGASTSRHPLKNRVIWKIMYSID